MKKLEPKDLERMRGRIALVDTSLLMLLADGIDVLDQLESRGAICVVPKSVLEELKRHASSPGRKGRAAKLVLSIIENRCYLLDERIEKHTDDDIVALALKYKLAVATADKGLRRRLLRKVPTLYLREGQRRIFSEDFFDL